jgi:hypothetical protein
MTLTLQHTDAGTAGTGGLVQVEMLAEPAGS